MTSRTNRTPQRLASIAVTIFAIVLLTHPVGHAATWSVQPDAQTAALRITAESGPLAVPAPAANGFAVFSSTRSPYVAISQHAKGMQVWNLETGKPTPLVPVVAGPGSRLRPDGKRLVADYVNDGKRYTAVWDTATGKRVWTASTAHRVSPQRDFGAGSQLLELSSKSIIVWDYDADRRVREIKCSESKYGTAQLSPTRRYVARPHRRGVQIYDLAAGKLVGELTFPDMGGHELRLLKLDYSSDGKELAALLRVSRDRRYRSKDTWAIASWSMTSGKLISRHEISREVIVAINPMNAPADIDCLADHSGWLLRNFAIVDRGSGKVVWTPKSSPDPRNVKSPSIVLDDGKILFRTGEFGAGSRLMTVVQPPRDLIRERIASLKKNPKQDFIDTKPAEPLGRVDWRQVHARVNRLKAVPADKRSELSKAKAEQLLKILESSDAKDVENAVEQLASAKPVSAVAKRVAEALREAATRQQSGFVTVAGHWAAAEWQRAAATHTSKEPNKKPPTGKAPGSDKYAALEADITSGSRQRMSNAYNRLATSGDPTAAEIVVKHFGVNRGMSTTTLMRMGKVAAPAMTKLLDSSETHERQIALTLLRQFGTSKQLPAIKKLLQDSNRGIQAQAKAAIHQIELRGS